MKSKDSSHWENTETLFRINVKTDNIQTTSKYELVLIVNNVILMEELCSMFCPIY